MATALEDYGLDVDLEKVCRICLSQTDASQRLVSIFSSAIVDGFLVAIPEVISFCLDLTITDTKGLPCKICQSCKTQLLNFYTFKKKCKRTEQVLQLTIAPKSNILPVATEPFDNGALEVDDCVSSEHLSAARTDEESSVDFEVAGLNQCQLCDRLFDEEADLRNHMASHLDDGEKTNEIVQDESRNGTTSVVEIEEQEIGAIAEARSPTPVDYWVPEELEELDSTSNNGELEDEPNEQMAEIEVVNSNSNNDHDQEEVRVVSYAANMICGICRKPVCGQTNFIRHMRTHEANASITDYFTFHICNGCRKVYLSKNQLTEHIEEGCFRQAGQEVAYKCVTCSLENANEQQIKQHVLSHLDSFSCPFEGCGCEYASFTRLGAHIASKHIKYESHQCQHCNMDSFNSMADLQHHLRTKCEGKKFPCNHCDKKFLTQRSLTQHLRCLEKNHRCDECGKMFAQQGELKLHQRIHNGERPFQCTVCGKSYKTASLRTAHMDSHIEGKTFQCQLCGKHLQTRTCYRNHIKRHSEEKKYECDVCSKMFYTKYNVKVHKTKVHKLDKGLSNRKQKAKPD